MLVGTPATFWSRSFRITAKVSAVALWHLSARVSVVGVGIWVAHNRPFFTDECLIKPPDGTRIFHDPLLPPPKPISIRHSFRTSNDRVENVQLSLWKQSLAEKDSEI